MNERSLRIASLERDARMYKSILLALALRAGGSLEVSAAEIAAAGNGNELRVGLAGENVTLTALPRA